MTFWRRIVPVVLCVLACTPVLGFGDEDNGTTESATEPLKSASSVRPQVYPAAQLATLFPAAVQISFAVAVVPDPLVPRYRRPYDLQIVALELGMLREGYVLDRFYLPWNDELRNDEAVAGASSPPAAPDAQPSLLQQAPMNHRYGLMIFRCDAWRSREALNPTDSNARRPATYACDAPVSEAATSGPRIRALYLVTDTATKGIESEAMLCAVDRINSQLSPMGQPGRPMGQRFPHCWRWPTATVPPSPAHTALLSYPDACQSSTNPSSTLLVLGPSFSGAVDSAAEVGKRLQPAPGKDLSAQPIKGMCLLSSSATDNTNQQANLTWGNAPFPVRYSSLALESNRKLRHIVHLSPALIGQRPGPNAITILAEGSTYGYGVCGYARAPVNSMADEVRDLCNSARLLYFPANIADIRYGMQQSERSRTQANPLKLALPGGHLSLDLGAENGSEYPESRQSALTSAGIQLALDQVLEQLQRNPPKLIIVVATDVRDRLFLFDELRKRLARPMLVDLESDNLIAHPDFLHASRGALAIGSAQLTEGATYGCERTPEAASRISTWSTDFQAILADTVARLHDPSSEHSEAPCDADSFHSRRPVVQIVSLEGLKVVTGTQLDSERGPDETGRPQEAGLWAGVSHLFADQGAMLDAAEKSAWLFCLCAGWLLVGPLVLPHPRRPSRSAVPLLNSVAGGVSLLYPVMAFLVARLLHRRDHDNLVCLVTMISLCVALAGLAVCVRALRQTTHTAPHTNLRNVTAPALLASSAVGFATTPYFWHASVVRSVGKYLDVTALEAIALDPDTGLAFLLLVALATFALLYSCVVLATSAGIVNRNSAVLREDQEAVTVATSTPTLIPEPLALGAPDAAAIPLVPVIPAVSGVPDPAVPSQLPRRDQRGALNLNPFGVFTVGALLISAIVLPDLLWGDVRLTIFGPFASRIALLALAATSLCATVLLACSLGMSRRIFAVSRYLATARKQSSEAHEDSIGRWPADIHGPRVFPPTPVVARTADGGAATKELLWADDLGPWRERVSEWLHHGHNDGSHRAAIFALLATEISVFRWCALGTVLCALGSIAAVYLFPIEADPLLLLNLAVLVGIGAVTALAATTFERDTLLSNVLCNRQAPRKFSTPLFAFVSVPFIALALALAITQVPGVVDWGGGILQLLGALGLHS